MRGRIYAIADAEALAPSPLPQAVAEMAAAGIRSIQVRAKKLSGIAELWVDDRADLAVLFPVGGLHLGQTDLPPAAARRVVGRDVAIGLSTHTEEQLAIAEADPEVSLIAVGPIFPTTGKERPDPVVGLAFLRWARAHTGKRLVAIGGVDADNVASALAAGADAAVVLGAVCRGDVRANCRRLLAAAGEGGCGST
jgi:thiamine-phosphate pyrophosphorylase